MKNKLHFLKTLIFSVFLLTLGCRQEADLINNEQQKTRAEEFFRNYEQNSKLTNSVLISNSIQKLKKFNNISNFLSKISDKSGLPVWSQIIDADVKVSKGTSNKGNETVETLIIPLRQEDDFLSSLMYVENPDSETPLIYTVTNQELQTFINNENIDKSIRESVLSTFVYFDYEIFANIDYSAIPPTLFENISLEDGKQYKSFSINNVKSTTTTTVEGKTAVVVCIYTYLECTCADKSNCDLCRVCVSTDCYNIGSTGGGSGPGDGSPGDGGPGNPSGHGSSGGGGNPPGGNGNPENECGGANRPFYRPAPDCDEGTYPFTYYYNLTRTQRDWLGLYPEIAQSFEDYLNSKNNYNSNLSVVSWAIGFLMENSDIVEPEKILERIETLDLALEQNPNLLLDITCAKMQQWQDVALYQIPQSVKNKINSIPNQNSYWSSWAITDIESGAGTKLNMDLFPVKITNMPNKPNGQKYTSAEFFDFFRKNINLFAEQFTPIEDNHYNIHDTALWNSTNPLGALIHIDITPDDGTVVCSGYSSNAWIFTTMKAPQGWSYDGIHPVAGNRKFSYYTDPDDNSVTIYTRGVDRTSKMNDANTPIINAIMQGIAFKAADQLWRGMQNRLSAYINNNGGTANKVQEETYRPNYEAVKNYVKGKEPISSLGCK